MTRLDSRHPIARPLAAAAFAATLLGTHVHAHAQSTRPGDITASTALTGFAQGKTDLDRGGDFSWGGILVSGNVVRQFTPEFSTGLVVRYEYQDWHWGQPKAFGGVAPWGSLQAPQIGVPLVWAPAPDWRLGLTPSIEWAFETGASTGDALTYGAVATATKIWSKDLVLGVGAAVYRQIDENKVFPFLIVNWQIDDQWRLTNPFVAGPAGGAGLELVYSPSDRWEFGGGGSYRSYKFRLKDSAPVADGIAENRFFPLFVRVGYRFDPRTRLDFYGAALVNGKLNLADRNGNDVVAEDYKTAPGIGLTLSHRY
jgi:hypothetical protein